MLDLLIRRKIEVLRFDIRTALAEAVRTSAPLELLFELAEGRDVLDELVGRGDAGAAEIVRGIERQLRNWDRCAVRYRHRNAA